MTIHEAGPQVEPFRPATLEAAAKELETEAQALARLVRKVRVLERSTPDALVRVCASTAHDEFTRRLQEASRAAAVKRCLALAGVN